MFCPSKPMMSPEPLAAKPIAGLSFVQEKTVPLGASANTLVAKLSPTQMD